MNNLVSVLIPAYNHEKYVQETIKSIINQTYQNIELIIVDDGSKDSTWQKIQELKDECEKRFVRVHFETKENEGTCKTFNRLLDLSQGEYVYFIASDDMAKPEAIETEVKFLSKHKDYALVVGDNEIIDADGKRAYWDNERNLIYDKKQTKFLTFCDFLKAGRPYVDFNSEDFGSYGSLTMGNYIPNGYLIRKSIFDKIGRFTPEAPLEDYWLMLQISKYSKMKYIDKILFSYRWHQTNSVKNIDKMENYTNITKNYDKNLLEKSDKNLLLKSVKEYLEFGIRYKTFGIKNIFQIIKYRKENKKNIIIKLFSFKILKIRRKNG